MKRLQVRFIISFLIVILLATILPFVLVIVIRNIGPNPEAEVRLIMTQLSAEQIEILGDFFRRSFLLQLALFLSIGGFIGTTAGILLSRNLTAPLIKLTNAVPVPLGLKI